MDFASLSLLDPVWWNWYLLGVVLLLLELLAPGVVIVWFGLGALATGLITELSGGLYWPLQLLMFSAFSMLALFSGRRLIKRAAPSKSTTLNRRLHSYLGRQSVLKSPIENGAGRIRLDGIYWPVRGPNLPVGTIVEVTGVDDATLVVGKAETNI